MGFICVWCAHAQSVMRSARGLFAYVKITRSVGQFTVVPSFSEMHRDRKAINTLSKVECSVTTVYSDHTSSILGFVLGNWSEYIIMHFQPLVVAPYSPRSNICKSQLINLIDFE